MDFKTFVFYFFSVVLVFASLRVITLRNPVHAALHLVLAFFSASGLWILLQAEFRMGCPVMAAVVEEPIDDVAEPVLDAAAAVFDSWIARLSQAMQARGRTREAADDFATFAVAGVEGAIVLCRAQRSIEPFDRVARQLQAMVANA